MTLSEKILSAHDIERRGELKPGDMVRVDVDWIMASELSWAVSLRSEACEERRRYLLY